MAARNRVIVPRPCDIASANQRKKQQVAQWVEVCHLVAKISRELLAHYNEALYYSNLVHFPDGQLHSKELDRALNIFRRRGWLTECLIPSPATGWFSIKFAKAPKAKSRSR